MTGLRSKSIYWSPDNKRIETILRQDVESLSEKDKVYLIKELDRRLIQFWDKVAYERKNNLVNYDIKGK